MLNKTSIEEKVLDYLESTHNIKVQELTISMQRNAANFGAKEYPYIANFTTDDIGIRKASLKFYDDKEIRVEFDTYPGELTCEISDKNIEAEGGDIPFVMYSKLMDGRADRLELNSSNLDLEELQEKIFSEAEFQTLVLVTAPDVKENKRKYEEFHIEMMRRLKAQGVEKSSLTFIFLDDQVDLDSHRISPRAVITSDSPIKQHTVQRWVSIHNNKWYDMVKDHPDKVLNYGDVYER